MDVPRTTIHVQNYTPWRHPKIDNGEKKKKDTISSRDASYWNILHIFGVLLACLLQTSIVTLIPRQNSMIYSNYWYEGIIVFVLGVHLQATANLIMEAFIFMGVKSILSISVFLIVFVELILSFVIPYSICYLIWTAYLGYNHPMPFIGGCGFVSWIASLFAFWYIFPPSLRKEKEFQTKLRGYIYFSLWFMVIEFQNNGLSIIFEVLPTNLQWIMAILIPSFRKFNTWIVTKITHLIVGPDDDMANFTVASSITSIYILFIAIQLSSATKATVYSILGVKFALHLKTCYQIVKLQTKINSNESERQLKSSKRNKVMLMLIVNETVEAVVPLSYAIGFALAFYGPNAKLIGNVRGSHFGLKEVEDVQHLYLVLFQMFGIDACAMILSSIALWIFCQINLIQEFCNVIKKYWMILDIKLAGLLALFFLYNDVNFAMDYTLQFSWITEKGISCSTINASNCDADKNELFLANKTME